MEKKLWLFLRMNNLLYVKKIKNKFILFFYIINNSYNNINIKIIIKIFIS